jgi:hypothetical protein
LKLPTSNQASLVRTIEEDAPTPLGSNFSHFLNRIRNRVIDMPSVTTLAVRAARL